MTTDTTPTAQNTTATITSPIVTDGAQPTVASPVVMTQEETPPVVPEAPPATEPPADTNNKSTPDWVQRRMNELTARRHEAERRANEEKEARLSVEAALAELKKGAPSAANTETATPPAMTQEQIDQLVATRAAEIAHQNDFNKACNDIVAVGKAEFKDTWDEAVKNLGLVGALGKNVSPEFLETAVELKSAAKVLHHLGQNLEEAERIVNLPPKKMALEMARIEALVNAPLPPVTPPPVSNAPPPVIPVGGAAKAGTPDIGDPHLTSTDWFELRAKQIEDRKSRYRRN